MTLPVPALALALAFEGDAVPEWVMLFPAGGRIEARDGRVFRMDASDASALMAAFAANQADIPIDLEHASHIRPEQGLDAPAHGWITKLEMRAGAMWGHVAWTPKGREYVRDRAYRYISPSFLHHPDGRAHRLVSAALTNLPAFKMPAVATEQPAQRGTPMDKETLEALGLAEGAKDDAVKTAVLALAKKATDAESALATATEKAKGAAPDPQHYVPRSDFEAATARVTSLENAENARIAADQEAAVDQAIAAGKVTPAGREFHLATCRAMGAAKFREHMDAQPAIATASRQVGVGEDPAKGKISLSDEEVAMARQFGRSAEDYAKLKAGDAR